MYNNNINSEVLQDVNFEKNKKTDWKQYKDETNSIVNIYQRINNKHSNIFIKKQENLHNCATYLEFKEFTDGTKKLNFANFCRERLCPVCSWRRSLKIFSQLSTVMTAIEEDFNYKFIFLTLTVKNMSDLKKGLDDLLKSFNIFNKRLNRMKVIKGFYRTLEITYNSNTNTYHPHFHLVIAVDKDYSRRHKNYITNDDFRQIWKECCKLDYLPQTYVETVRGNIGSGIVEVAKYSVKSKDIISCLSADEQEDVLYTFTVALASRRLISYSGIFREYHKKLNLQNIESDVADLVLTSDDSIRLDLDYIIKKYSWGFGSAGLNYYLVKE